MHGKAPCLVPRLGPFPIGFVVFLSMEGGGGGAFWNCPSGGGKKNGFFFFFLGKIKGGGGGGDSFFLPNMFAEKAKHPRKFPSFNGNEGQT